MYATLTAWHRHMAVAGQLLSVLWIGPAGYYPHRLDTTASNDT
jgi:hypothetical protein